MFGEAGARLVSLCGVFSTYTARNFSFLTHAGEDKTHEHALILFDYGIVAGSGMTCVQSCVHS